MAQRPKDEAETERGGFLSRWSARKSEVARGHAVPDEPPVPVDEAGGAEVEASDEDAQLSDTELLAKYELPDPDSIQDEGALDRFLSGEFPERLRQMALRRLWRLNPLFGIVDEMVEYGEDYTDAATVFEGMQTAYSAGKGYARQVPEEEVEGEGDAGEAWDVADETDDGQSLDMRGEADVASGPATEAETEQDADRGAGADMDLTAGPAASSPDPTVENLEEGAVPSGADDSEPPVTSSVQPFVQPSVSSQGRFVAQGLDVSEPNRAGESPDSTSSDQVPKPRPARMVFTESGS